MSTTPGKQKRISPKQDIFLKNSNENSNKNNLILGFIKFLINIFNLISHLKGSSSKTKKTRNRMMAMRIMILYRLTKDSPRKVKRIVKRIVTWSHHIIRKWIRMPIGLVKIPVIILRIIAIPIYIIAVKGIIRIVAITIASTIAIINLKVTRQYLINNLQGRIRITSF